MFVLETPKREKAYVSAYLNRETIEKIDILRGEVPRSRVVQRALNQFLEREPGAKASGVAGNNKS